MPTHALVTGAIAGRIPVPSTDYEGDAIDVTPDILYFEHDGDTEPPPALLAVAEAIDTVHRIRGTHPEQIGEL